MSALVLSEGLCRSGIAVPGVPQQQRLSPVHVEAVGGCICLHSRAQVGRAVLVLYSRAARGGQGVSFVAGEGMVLLFWHKEV